MIVKKELRLRKYFFKTPLQPHSLHLYNPSTLVIFNKDSQVLRLLDLRIVPILLHPGHLEVSGKVL